jgi:hypothetical protein
MVITRPGWIRAASVNNAPPSEARRHAAVLDERADAFFCTQVLHAVHGMHAMYSADIPRSVGC